MPSERHFVFLYNRLVSSVVRRERKRKRTKKQRENLMLNKFLLILEVCVHTFSVMIYPMGKDIMYVPSFQT